ncbi:unnamed protein product [Acanthoscelides obtectus]|uniref:C2H2-type domain-containing protein n=2 Tax=Acanthoscelides obtectus TaxID=200917 RepID=A0A9P0L372_ACAOB|nr:unnamed protein product [Acanthoscelides obtectus]CAK1676635.1 Transcription factor IIIA [Acanthoscelides obtectus]
MCSSDTTDYEGEAEINSENKIVGKHQCSYHGCNVSYKKLSLLKRHIIKHTGERPYPCDVDGCNKSFQQSYHLKRHIETVHMQCYEFVCDESDCGKSFASSSTLKKHKTRSHSLHTCSQCSKEFKKKYQLKNHILSHGSNFHENESEHGQNTSKKSIRCSFKGCTASYSKQYYLTLHMRKHTGERPFVCDIGSCDKSYTQAYHLNRHKARVHEPSKEYICKEAGCGHVLSDKYNLKKHIDRYHSSNGPYKCFHCMQGFYKKYVLRKHLATHSEDPGPIKCKKCNLVFPTRTNYLKHMYQHKTYSCTCGVVFYRSHMFRRHKKRYCSDQNNVHTCTVCKKTFTTAFNLKQHSKVHSEVKQTFKCHYSNCQRSYEYKKNLLFHINHFHESSGVRYECPDCSMTFKEKVYMKRHVQNIHMDKKETKTERKPRKDKGKSKPDKHLVAMSGLNPALKSALKKCKTNITVHPNEEESNMATKEIDLSSNVSESARTSMKDFEANKIVVNRELPTSVPVDMLQVCYSEENSPESTADVTLEPGDTNIPEKGDEVGAGTIEMNDNLEVEFADLLPGNSYEGSSQKISSEDQSYKGAKIVVLKIDVIKECDRALQKIKDCIS